MSQSRLYPLVVALVLLAMPTVARAQSNDVRVTVSEGTNMAAAVSPDGARIVLDLQGTLWVREEMGTEARAITDMYYDARQPQWAPDGSRIVFQSFRDGNWHIWSIRPDGTDPIQHTKGHYDHREPQYSPDGRTIALSSDRAGNYDVWVLRLEDGELFQVTDAETHEFTPSWSSDGEALTYASSRDGGTILVRRGERGAEEVVARARGATSPAWSPDGRLVAFPAVGQGQTALHVAELGTGPDAEPRTLSRAGDDVFPFRPHWRSSAELLYTSDGVIKTVDLEGNQGAGIAFSATFEFSRPTYERRVRDFDASGPEPVRGIVAPAGSPDGRQVAFGALGDLWLLDIGDPTPRRLTDDPFVDGFPVWSRDGRRLAWVSDRNGSLDVWVRDMDTGAERQITSLQGGEVAPVWSPDGSEIVFTSVMGLGSQLRRVDVASGEVQTLRADLFAPGRVSWSPDGSILAMSALTQYSTRFREGRNEILLMPLDGGPDRRVTADEHRGMGVRALDGPVWSPDGHLMAYVTDGVLWTVAVDRTGTPIGPPTRLTNHHADALSWAGDSRSIVYQTVDGLRRAWLDDGRIEEIPLELTWQRPEPEQTRLVVHASRAWDGTSDEAARNVDIIVVGNRIESVVPHDDDHHAGRVVDAGDHTVLPGLIDMHSHMGYGLGEALGRIFLSYGVTTIRDPSSDSYDIRERREAVETGRRVGPREFATGRIMDGNRIYYSIASSLGPNGHLELELDRAERLGYSLIKTYVRMPDLMQRRIIEHAHSIGIPVSSHEIYPAVAHGADHVEHISGTSRRGYSPKVTAMYRTYDDVISLLNASGMTITPTMALMGGWWKVAGEDPDWMDDDRMRQLLPPGAIEQMRDVAVARGRVGGLESLLADAGETITRVVRGGGRVVAGTDSPIIPYGAALIAEVENYVWGGLTEVEALRSATSVAAGALAMEGELGTLSGGALADMLIVEGNPLDDISDLRRARYVIKDGRVFTLEELLERPRALVP
ncbi:MAG: amidohydrolase family protein [Gemmatimonadetes bacterium]|nr:amidohydrolase family protein [Gemmatimonadota bacterium]